MPRATREKYHEPPGSAPDQGVSGDRPHPTAPPSAARMGLWSMERLVSGSVKRPYRVVVAKPGLDGHDRGAEITARALRDSGFEVIYSGLHQSADQVVRAVLQEDADAVGLTLSGGHLALVTRVVDGLREHGLTDVLVLVEGDIPAGDVPALKNLGVAGVFTPETPGAAMGAWLGALLDARESGEVA
jgi:methylmalonyl-CoA mutase, C-terminal domain